MKPRKPIAKISKRMNCPKCGEPLVTRSVPDPTCYVAGCFNPDCPAWDAIETGDTLEQAEKNFVDAVKKEE